MRVLVTGGAGFIGSHVVDLLVEGGHEVVSLDRLHPRAHAGRPAYLRDDVEHIDADLAAPAAARVLDRAVDGVDAVCHQAAMVGLGRELGDVVDYVRDNDLGTAALLAAVARHRRIGRLVLAGSMVVYGEGAYRCGEHGPVRPRPRPVGRLAAGRFEPPCPRCGADLEPVAVTEDAPPDPRSVYAATKLHQEHLATACALAGGPPVTALRYHNVYGPRMPRGTPYAGVAAIFRSALAAGQPPQVFEDGGQRRDFVHVTDVARANLAALTSPEPVPGAFNVASGQPHTVGELAAALAVAVNGPAPRSWAAGGRATSATWSPPRPWPPLASASGPGSALPREWPSSPTRSYASLSRLAGSRRRCSWLSASKRQPASHSERWLPWAGIPATRP